MDEDVANDLISAVWYALDMDYHESAVRDVVEQAIRTWEPD